MSGWVGDKISLDPDTNLFGGAPDIYQIDTITGNLTLVFNAPLGTQEFMEGLVSAGAGIFYSMDDPAFGDNLYEININAATVLNLGSTGISNNSDLTLYNGQIYYRGSLGIVRLDINNPSASELVISAPEDALLGLTASPYCNTLISVVDEPGNNRIELINLLDGTIIPLCDGLGFFAGITSMREHQNPTPCEVLIDLDCDDSDSYATFDCLSTGGVAVTDQDISLFADNWLDIMTISIASPIPDSPDEILFMTASIPNIDETGSGTSVVTLTNAGGATIQDFKDALQLIVYKNLSSNPTGGLRTIQVQFTTESGTMSNIAEYYIDVDDLGHLTVDLGPDMEICDGTSFTLNAGNPGASYAWSTGESSQTISVDASGEYMVTVSDGGTLSRSRYRDHRCDTRHPCISYR